jgi:Ca-activated chloride channel family protein
MRRFRTKWLVMDVLILIFLCAALVALLAGTVYSQDDSTLSNAGEACLLYKSPIAGVYAQVPLIHTDVQIDVRGLAAAATVTQKYKNSSSDAIEAVYVFPLPHDAAVYDMEIRIGDRVIHSAIKERAEAKRVYEQAKSGGKRAALLEQERPNIFTASVANIMPGDEIDVRVLYVEPLKWEDGRIRLVFPMVVGPRYIAGSQAVGHSGTGWAMDTDAVSDASRITPQVRNPENRSGHDISVSVDLDTGFGVSTAKSISHEVKASRLSDGRQHVELAGGTTIPNKNFVLEVQQAANVKPTAALFLSPASASGDTHFLIAAYPPTVQPREHRPMEMLYMIDVSGSMEGTSIEQAKAALLQALNSLHPEDRFGILAFSSGYQEFAAEPLQATTENLAAARRYVGGLEANGGTEMLPALVHLMQKPQTPGYLRHIILLTDGDLGNEDQIFAALQRDLNGARLFTVAIGSAPNLYLATKMAQYGRGTFTHIADINEVQSQMTKLFATIETPVLTDVTLSFDGAEVTDVYPQRIPDLFLRQPLLIFGRIVNGHKGTVHLRGEAAGSQYESAIPFDTSKATMHPGITTLWARQLVEHQMDQWPGADENKQAEIRSAVIANAIRYHLVTRFTSLVAVEDVVSNVNGQPRKVGVPTELPAGWEMEKVLGAPATGTADEFLQALGISLLLVGIVMALAMRKAGAWS